METIGADAAKLAGLQIDFLQKFRNGQITTSHLEWFLGLTKEERTLLSGTSTFDPRFQLVNTFYLVVPYGYDHATRLASFRREHGRELSYCNPNITDEKFSRVTIRLVPGRRLKVKVFQITQQVSSEDCLAFLRTQNAVFVGAQGASLAYELARDQLPVSRGSISFDKRKALWKDIDGYRWEPSVVRGSDGRFSFYIDLFNSVLSEENCLLCFCDPSA